MIRFTSSFSDLSPETSNTFKNVSSEQVAKTDFEGWQLRALTYLECALISQNTIPFEEINFT